MGKISQLIRAVFISILKGYAYLISPLLGNNCRFYPSCSRYAMEAIEQHGVLSGFWLTAKRLSKCHPGYEGGFDPVPNGVKTPNSIKK